MYVNAISKVNKGHILLNLFIFTETQANFEYYKKAIKKVEEISFYTLCGIFKIVFLLH